MTGVRVRSAPPVTTTKVVVGRCTECPLSARGFEWSPECRALATPRALPKSHDPDGPPPSWCPLPVAGP